VRLQSKDPAVPPLIDTNYFNKPEDMTSMIEGIKVILKVFETTKAFGEFGAKFTDKAFPGCEKFPLRSDAYFACYARYFTGTTWHPSGTCRMGKSTGDPLAVVDSSLRVIGVKNLRIADTSVMPAITNGNLNAPTIMIGEKTAEMLLKTWMNKNQVQEGSEDSSDSEDTFTYSEEYYG